MHIVIHIVSFALLEFPLLHAKQLYSLKHISVEGWLILHPFPVYFSQMMLDSHGILAGLNPSDASDSPQVT